MCAHVFDVVIKTANAFRHAHPKYIGYGSDIRLIFLCDQKSKIDVPKKRLRVALGDYVIECCQKSIPFPFIYQCGAVNAAKCVRAYARMYVCMRSKSKSILQLRCLFSRFTFHLLQCETIFVVLLSYWHCKINVNTEFYCFVWKQY